MSRCKSSVPLLIVLLAALLALLAACNDATNGVSPGTTSTPPSPNGDTPAGVTAAPRPDGVPETAFEVLSGIRLGQFIRSANEPTVGEATRQLEAVSCQNDVAVLSTSTETIYMTLACDNFLAPGSEEIFIDKEVAIVLDVDGERPQVFLETIEGAQAQFSPAGIWLE